MQNGLKYIGTLNVIEGSQSVGGFGWVGGWVWVWDKFYDPTEGGGASF